MASGKHTIVFHPPGDSVEIGEGETLIDAARRGKIFVNSKPGEGSTFEIILPAS